MPSRQLRLLPAPATQANVLRAERDQAQRDAQAAKDRAEALAAGGRRATGVLARLRDAWRGE